MSMRTGRLIPGLPACPGAGYSGSSPRPGRLARTEEPAMSTPTDPEGVVRTLLERIKLKSEELPDVLSAGVVTAGGSGAPARPLRLLGPLAELAEKEMEIARGVARHRGAVTQAMISRRLASSSIHDCEMLELYRKEEADRSSTRGQWYGGLAPPERAAFDHYCLVIAGAVLDRLFPPDIPGCLCPPLAGLALEYAALVRRADAERNETEKCLVARGSNHTVVKNVLRGITEREEEARSHLVGRWFRELTAEQAAAFAPPASGRAGRLGAEPEVRVTAENQGSGASREPTSEAEAAPELNDRQRLILEAMLDNELTSERRRQSRAQVVRLIHREHKPGTYSHAFAGLAKHGYLRSREGPRGGVWLTAAGKAEAEAQRSSNWTPR
jgi:hypothetical protein